MSKLTVKKTIVDSANSDSFTCCCNNPKCYPDPINRGDEAFIELSEDRWTGGVFRTIECAQATLNEMQESDSNLEVEILDEKVDWIKHEG